MSEKKQGNYHSGSRTVAMWFYIIAAFAGSYSLALLFSGFYANLDGTLGYSVSCWRVIFVLFLLTSISYVHRQPLIKQSDYQSILGSARTLQLLTGFAFLVSVLVSVFSPNINEQITGWYNRTEGLWGNNYTQAIHVSPFSLELFELTTVLAILVLFVLHGLAYTKVKSDEDERQQAEIKALRDAMRVAPPLYFTEMLADVTDQSEDFLSSVSNDYLIFETALLEKEKTAEELVELWETTLEDQRKAIRAVLTGFGRLARTYDDANRRDPNPSIEYRANLMLNLDAHGMALQALFPSEMPLIRFKLPHGAKPSSYLVIDRQLSVLIGDENSKLYTTKTNGTGEITSIHPNDFNADDQINDALLPVYFDEGEPQDNYNMIGAPTAIIKGKPVFISDTIQAINQVTDYSGELLEEAKQYFQTDTKGRSIVSLPVATRHFKLDKVDVDPSQLYGTINLYRNEKDIFSGEAESFKFFTDFTRPLSIILGRIVEQHIGTLIQHESLAGTKINIDSTTK